MTLIASSLTPRDLIALCRSIRSTAEWANPLLPFMSRRVYGWDQNPLTDHHPFRCSNSSADYAVSHGIAELIIDGDGREAIQLIEPAPFERELRRAAESGPHVSAKAIILFIRTHCTGDKLHYEIPHAGDRSLYARHHRRLVHVSGRSVFDYRYQCARTA